MTATRRKRRPGRILKTLAVAWGLAALLAAAGCQQLAGGAGFSGSPIEQPIPTGRFHDVPVPANYRLIPDKTFIYENPTMKAGILTYRGNLSVADTSNFFKEHMPANGWRLVSSFEVNDVILKFEKIGWTCDISVQPGFEREVVIRIGPTSEGPGPGPSIPPPPSG